MKKLFIVLFVFISMFSIFAESNVEYRVVQDRVIELTYNTFDYQKGIDIISENYDPKSFAHGCSAVKVVFDDAVYVGRNLDFYCSDSPAFIIRNNAGKYKTVAIGNSPDSFRAWEENYQVSDRQIAAAPYLISDIMNENGVYGEVNIRVTEPGYEVIETNPGAPRMCTQCFLQYMLSHYGTIDEILEHIGDYDWYDLCTIEFEEAFFLCDSTGRSVIVEFAANECRWQEQDYQANYYINNDWYSRQTLMCGEKRNARQLAYRPFVRTEDDIFTMMKFGAYAQFYKADCDVDFAIDEYYTITGYNKITAAEDYEGCYKATKAWLEYYDSFTWDEMVANRCWETTFAVAANLTDMYFHVHFSEHYNIDFVVNF